MSLPQLQKPAVDPPIDRRKMEQMRGLVLLLLAIVYLFYALTDWVGEFIVLGLTVVTFVLCWPFMTRLPQIISAVMLTLGHLLFFTYGGDKSYWTDALFQNLAFVAMFVSVPLLSIPIRVGGYVEYIVTLMRRYQGRPYAMHSIVSSVAFLLTSFMNIGSLRIMDELFGNSFGSHRDRFIKAVMQGFFLSVIFSPYIAGVAVVLLHLNVSIFSFLVYGLLIITLGFLISLGLAYWEIPKQEVRSEPTGRSKQSVSSSVPHNKGRELLIAFLGLFMTIILVDQWFDINLVIVISLIAVTYPFLWILFIRKQKEMTKHLRHYSESVLPNVHNESIMIIAASFFAQMVQLSPLPNQLSGYVNMISAYSPFLLILAILFSIYVLSLFGIHQILPVTIYATSIAPAEIGLSPVLFAIVLTAGWGIAALSGPISALNIVASSLFGMNNLQLSRWNMKFVMFFILLTTIVVFGMNHLLV